MANNIFHKVGVAYAKINYSAILLKFVIQYSLFDILSFLTSISG